ncbi:GntR family transcriptional regulator [Streptomyces sp. CBMA291]|nr:GntR family transcriptional regulator [Streptomyces sp. CBMA291]MBD0716767.1 GntR family transcriptional regulator [Streptomyces sp. CBMA370]
MASRRHVIADDLRNLISTGRLKARERLPSEAELAVRYQVSTPTLRNALALLQAEGLIEKIHGKGNFVRRPLPRVTYVGGGLVPAQPVLPVSVHVKKLRARGDVAALLRVAAGSPVTELRFLSHDGQTPHSLAHVYVPRDLAPTDVPADPHWPQEVASLLSGSLPLLTEVQEKVLVRLPTPPEAAALRISSTLAILAVTRVATDTTGRVIEVALLVLPGDRTDAVFTTRHTTGERSAEG